MRVEFCRHNLEAQDIRETNKVLHSLFLTTGQWTNLFEKKFSRWTCLPHVIGVNSCTAALQLTFLGLGIGSGDEVITTPLTFVASATSILHVGAKPIFVDVEPDTGLIDPQKIEKAINKKTKAIVAVHLYGMMCDMRRIHKIAKKHRLFVIEDCAHCIEGERDGVRPGQLSDAACYSFYATKNLACGEGGAVATRSKTLATKIRQLRLHGMTLDAARRYRGPFQHYDVTMLGWKYNLDNIHASLLIHQLDRLKQYWRQRHKLSQRYEKILTHQKKLEFPKIYGKSAHHLQTIWVNPKRRDRLARQLRKNGIGVAVNYRPLHLLTYFRRKYGYHPSDFPNAFAIGQKTLSLPLYPKLTFKQQDYVIHTLLGLIAE